MVLNKDLAFFATNIPDTNAEKKIFIKNQKGHTARSKKSQTNCEEREKKGLDIT